MHRPLSSMIRIGQLRSAGLAIAATGVALLLQVAPVQAAPPQTGIACTTSTSPNPTFTLTATDGYIQLPDGNTMYMWGYALGGGAFQHPGPVLCVNEGDTVTVVLNNSLARGRLDHVPRPGERTGQWRAGAAAGHGCGAHLADQRGSAAAAASPTASSPLIRAPTSMKAARCRRSRCAWGCSAR